MMKTINNHIYQKWNTFFYQLGFFSCVSLGLWSSVATAGATISTGVMISCFFFTSNWKRKIKLIQHPIVIMAFVLFFWEIVGVFYSVGSWSESLNIALKYNKLLIIWCVVYFVCGNLKRFYWVLSGLFLGVILNLIAIFINYFLLSQNWAIEFVRANWPSAQGHGQFALFTLIFSFGCLTACFIKSINIKWRYSLFVLGSLGMFAEVFLNSSRTGYLMEFTLMLFLLVQVRKLKLFLGILSLIVMFFSLAYLCSPIFNDRVDVAVQNTIGYFKGEKQAYKNFNITSEGYRLNFYATSGKILYNEPKKIIFGYGSGSYEEVTKKYFNNVTNKNKASFNEPFVNPHNQYILFLFENGIIGLLLFLSFLYVIWRYSTILPLLWKGILLVSIISMMINMIFNSAFMDYLTSIVFISILATFAAYKPTLTFKNLPLFKKASKNINPY